MISPKKLDEHLKRHQLALVLCPEGTLYGVGPPRLNELEGLKGEWAYGTHSYVNWDNRMVLLEEDNLGWGAMVHELVHAAYEEPPNGMPSESCTWMYAVERQLAKEWRMLRDWLDYFDDTPIEGVEGYGQIMWGNMSKKDRTTMMDVWFEVMNDSGIHFEGKQLAPLPVFDGQDVRTYPRGLSYLNAHVEKGSTA